MVHLIKFPLNMFSCFTATTSTFWHGRVFPTPLAWNVVLCVLLHGGHQGAVSGGKGSQKAKLAISYEVYDVVPAPWRAEDHQRRVRTGRCKHHFSRFIVMPFWNCYFFVHPGHLHLLRLRKVGSAKKGRIHFWIQVLRRQGPELIYDDCGTSF